MLVRISGDLGGLQVAPSAAKPQVPDLWSHVKRGRGMAFALRHSPQRQVTLNYGWVRMGKGLLVFMPFGLLLAVGKRILFRDIHSLCLLHSQTQRGLFNTHLDLRTCSVMWSLNPRLVSGICLMGSWPEEHVLLWMPCETLEGNWFSLFWTLKNPTISLLLLPSVTCQCNSCE